MASYHRKQKNGAVARRNPKAAYLKQQRISMREKKSAYHRLAAASKA